MTSAQPKSLVSGLIGLVLFLFFVLAALPGCGEIDADNDEALRDTPAKDAEADPGAGDALTLEHWNTVTGLLSDSQSATFTSITGDQTSRIRTGDNEDVAVSLSLVEQDNRIRGDVAVTLESPMSVTGHPIAFSIAGAPVTVDENGLTVTGSTVAALTNGSGSLIRTAVDMTLTITRSSAGMYLCRVLFDAPGLDIRCTFDVEVFRTSAAAPVSFCDSTWKKESPGIVIGFPRRQYSDQTEISAVPGADLLTLTVNTDALNPMAALTLDLPEELSPNRTPLSLALVDTAVLYSDEHRTLMLRTSGTLPDIPDLSGALVSTDYHLTLTVTKTVVTESYRDAQNNPAQREAARYTGEMRLIVDALGTRSTLIQPLSRLDSSDAKASFSGARFVLAGGTTRYITHAVTAGDTTDLVQAPFGLIQFSLTLTPTPDGPPHAVGELFLPMEVTPAWAPSYSVVFHGTPTDPVTDDALRIDATAQVDKTDALGFLTSDNAPVTLRVDRDSSGVYRCSLSLSSADRLTRIRFDGLELTRQDGGPGFSGGTFTALAAPYHMLGCSSPPNTQMIVDGDLDLSVTLHKRVADDRVFVSAEGSLDIVTGIDCTGEPLSLTFENVFADMAPSGNGFGLSTQIGEGADAIILTVGLIEAAQGRFEFQVDAIAADGTVLDLTVPASRTGGTEVFVRAAP
ncbi:hypothetical protein JCM14469_27390 [Desulfatiferula olefinivorans]